MSSVGLKTRPMPKRKLRPQPGTDIPSLTSASHSLSRERAATEKITQPIAVAATAHPAWYRSEGYELVNALTHGTGLLLALVGALVMGIVVANTGDVWRIIGCGSFVASMIAVYGASTLSHSGFAARWRTFLRRLDQGVIYFLVVATYTPFGLAYLRTGAGWLLLAALWTGATAGFLSKFWLAHKLDANMIWTYVVLGVLPTITIPWLWSDVPIGATIWMFLGGMCYLAGTFFLMNDSRVRHFHAVWHVLVIAGSVCHFVAILESVARAAN
jgi:hemolysin III